MIEQMDCQTYRAHLDEWIDGELSAALVPSMEAHRDACPECAEETRRALEAIELIRSLDAEVPVPLEAQVTWRNAVRSEARQRRRHRFGAAMRAATSIAATFVLLAGCTLGFRSAGMLNPMPSAAPVALSAAESDTGRLRKVSHRTNGVTYVMGNGASTPYAYIASDGEEDVNPLSDDVANDLAVEPEDGVQAETLLIRSVERTIATDSFDAAAQNVRDLADQYGGYLETDSTTTQQDGLRIGQFTAVIPALEADSFLQTIDHVGNVIYTAEHFEDASVTVRDASARMSALEAEKQRLTELISQADTADELTQLNALLQSTLTEIDSLQSENNRLSNELDNVRVSIRVEELYAAATAEPTQAPGLSQRMSAAFSESAQNLQLFVHDMAVSLMIIAPFALAVLGLAAAITVIVLVIRHHWKKRKNRNS